MREVNLSTWEETTEMYPRHTTREKMSTFLNCNFQHGNRPAALVAFAKEARDFITGGQFDTQIEGAFIGQNGATQGHIITMDILKLDDNIIRQRVKNFGGFNLAVVDYPQVTAIPTLMLKVNKITTIVITIIR